MDVDVLPSKEEERVIEEYLDQFNNDFETSLNIKKQEYPLICRIFEDEYQDYTTGKLYKGILNKMLDIENKLLPTFTHEQKILFNEWNGLTDRLCFDEIKQMFILGFCSAKEIYNELKALDKNRQD